LSSDVCPDCKRYPKEEGQEYCRFCAPLHRSLILAKERRMKGIKLSIVEDYSFRYSFINGYKDRRGRC